MFDWWKNKKDKDSNIVPFPELKEYTKPPEPEKPAHTYYRLGITDNNRVSFQMGYSEITMNAAGVNNMIKQLEVFRDQLQEQTDEENDES